MKGKKEMTPTALVNKTLDTKSVEFLLGECGRLRADLIALTKNCPPPPPPPRFPDESSRIHGVVQKRFREFENSTKEEIQRQKKKSLDTRIIRPPHRKPPQETKPNKPILSVEKLRSFEFIQARPKSNVGYYHFIHAEDNRERVGERSHHLVVQNTANINISPEKMRENESHDDELSKNETEQLKEESLKSSSVEWHNSTLRDVEQSDVEEAEGSPQNTLSEDISYTLDSTKSKALSEYNTSQKSETSSHTLDSIKRSKNLSKFLLHADKSVIERLPLDEKNENNSTVKRKRSPTRTLYVKYYATLYQWGKTRSFLSTIEEQTENEVSFHSLSRRSHEVELSRSESLSGGLVKSLPSSGLSFSDLRSYKKAVVSDKDLTPTMALSEGQFIQEGSCSKGCEDLETDMDDVSSSDTFTISVL
ncbi:unnamed protein product [Lepeophtheirus salmonis]|uniref:(salmon louse) hypothetical protein n=1 Tax=Lepeophtheirus salmonis TaxID=72036 RepID=A0A7R8D5C0_LEPSM|nr:unnamed protein product [Lepeophtheirus salmonis]CAF3034378.1 unnamed protein product [Lepeophtheirus salmonis]